jgi:hypothetical protein
MDTGGMILVGRRRKKFSEKNLPKCKFVHQKSQTN